MHLSCKIWGSIGLVGTAQNRKLAIRKGLQGKFPGFSTFGISLCENLECYYKETRQKTLPLPSSWPSYRPVAPNIHHCSAWFTVISTLGECQKKKTQLSKSGAMIRTVGEQNKARRELFVGNYLRRDNNCDKDWSPELNYEIPWRSTYILITMTAFVSLVHTWGTGFLRTPALIKIAGWIASWRSLGSNSEAPTLEKDIQPENTSDWEGNYVDNY